MWYRIYKIDLSLVCGTWYNNNAHGSGTKIKNSKLYVGSFNDGAYKGCGTWISRSRVERGYFINNAFAGIGIQDKLLRCGYHINEELCGQGTQCNFASQSFYIGNFDKNKCSGFGIHIEDQSRGNHQQFKSQTYKGHLLNNKYDHGFFKVSYCNHSIIDTQTYSGPFKNNYPLGNFVSKIYTYQITEQKYNELNQHNIYQDDDQLLKQFEGEVLVDQYIGETTLVDGVLLNSKSQTLSGSQMKVISISPTGTIIGRITSSLGTYEGEIVDGLMHGFGVFVADYSIYKGEWHRGQKHGKGIFKHESQRYEYDGGFVLDQFYGYGIKTYSNGRKYQGHFVNGLYNGYGVYRFEGGEIYEGQFLNGMQHGYGKYTKKNDTNSKVLHFEHDVLIQGFIKTDLGRIYVGEVPNELRKEIGIYVDQDRKSLSCGSFSGTKKQGYVETIVEFMHASGEWRIMEGVNVCISKFIKVSGNWVDNILNSGTIQWDHGTKYDGQLLDNKFPNVFGKITQVNGTIYEGEFKKQQIIGFGCAIFSDGSKYTGSWDYYRPEREGVYIWFIEGEQYTKLLFQGSIRAPIPEMGDTFQDDLYTDLLWWDQENIYSNKIQIKLQYEYIGNWQKGKFNGYGELSTNEISYKGEFYDHLMHGQGTLVIKDHSYTGIWNKGQFEDGIINLQNYEELVSNVVPDWIEYD